MKNRKLSVLVAVLCALVLVALVGCTEKQATVTFVFGDDFENHTENVPIGQKVTAPDADKIPQVEGKKIVGWFLTATGENEWKFDENVAEADTTLYAKWDWNTITVQEALDIASKLASGETTTERYYIRGTVKSIVNPTYGQMVLQDDTGEISVYGTYSADGEKRYSELTDKPYANDEVVLSSVLKNFNGNCEINNGRIVDFQHKQDTVDETKYTQMTVQEARDAKKGALAKVSGVVACITYANGKVPSGFILVDKTSSIYVFDSQIAPRVQKGNTVTILGEKDYWILETEQAAAEKQGYAGCCQLTNVVLKENDNLTTGAYDKSWITTTTVKEIMDTPYSENITTKIFKVNALVKKAPGTGFVNYYIDDLDGKTGSYVYSQCNGGDFDWLDEFDGKICTVYVTALNAKSTSTGCIWRLLPIEVSDDGFVFQEKNAPEFAVKYYGVEQFAETYSADPSLKLLTEVSSELLGIDKVALSYDSDNKDVAYIENGVLHTNNDGTAQITVSAKYKDFTYSQKVTVTVHKINIESISVTEAIAAAVGDTVTVRGIVGPSLVNQTGFYLVDDGAVIAVRVKDASVFEGLKVGHEVIVSGKRDLFKGSETFHGETCISDGEIAVNLFGEHEYSTKSFKNGTLEEIKTLPVTEDHTTEVYVITAKIKFVYAQYYTNAYIVTDEDDKGLILYSKNAGTQYGWLKDLDGKEVTLEVAPVMWNGKSIGLCVLAVRNADGTKTVNELNFEH